MPKRATPKPLTLDVSGTLDALNTRLEQVEFRLDTLERLHQPENQTVRPADVPDAFIVRVEALEAAVGVNPPATDGAPGALRTVLNRLDALEQAKSV